MIIRFERAFRQLNNNNTWQLICLLESNTTTYFVDPSIDYWTEEFNRTFEMSDRLFKADKMLCSGFTVFGNNSGWMWWVGIDIRLPFSGYPNIDYDWLVLLRNLLATLLPTIGPKYGFRNIQLASFILVQLFPVYPHIYPYIHFCVPGHVLTFVYLSLRATISPMFWMRCCDHIQILIDNHSGTIYKPT